jgi:hypothetical protein
MSERRRLHPTKHTGDWLHDSPEETRMNTTTAARVLIVGENAQRATDLLERLESLACEISFAENCAITLRFLKHHHYDFILSQLTLADGNASQFLRPLRGTCAYMFFSDVLENGCWWLRVLDRGQNLWRKPTLMGPGDFLFVLERCIREECGNDTQHSNDTTSFKKLGTAATPP